MQESKQQIIALFQQIHEGNRAAFNELFLLYYDRLVAFAQQYTKQPENAEEIASELFVKIWMKQDDLVNILNPEVYLFVSVKNACLNLIRANKKRKQLFPEEEETNPEKMGSDNGTVIETKELSSFLDQAINNLPEQRKIIFKLIKEDGLKCKEVAEILSISNRTVENQLYKAVKTLADVVSGYLGYHPQQQISKKQALSTTPLLFFL